MNPAPWWKTLLKRRFDTVFRPEKFLAAPNQHLSAEACSEKLGNTAFSSLSRAFFHIHSKTACRGFKSFCPCQKPAETLGFRRFSFCMCCMVMVFTLVQTSSFCIHLRLSATVLIPSSTQNAPGFAFFGSIRVRFLVFCPFGRAKFLALLLCTLPHSVYRLKSLVIPVRREVSFLT